MNYELVASTPPDPSVLFGSIRYDKELYFLDLYRNAADDLWLYHTPDRMFVEMLYWGPYHRMNMMGKTSPIDGKVYAITTALKSFEQNS